MGCDDLLSQLFDVGPERVPMLLSGDLGLGSLVWNTVGYTEELFPLIIVGQFVPINKGSTPPIRYELDRFRRRIVLDASSRCAMYEYRVALTRRWRSRRVRNITDFKCIVVDGWELRALRLVLSGDSELAVSIDTDLQPCKLMVLGTRIEKLWRTLRQGMMSDRIRLRDPDEELQSLSSERREELRKVCSG